MMVTIEFAATPKAPKIIVLVVFADSEATLIDADPSTLIGLLKLIDILLPVPLARGERAAPAASVIVPEPKPEPLMPLPPMFD